jgi:hypothetical protein
MGHRIDELFQQWHQIGGAVLLAESAPDIPAPQPETLIAESTALCRESGRLTWVTLDWLVEHIEDINTDELIAETRQHGDLSVLGVIADAANQRRPNNKFVEIMLECPPNDEIEPFFHRVAKSALASQLAREQALDVFRRWNYLSNELRFLQDG